MKDFSILPLIGPFFIFRRSDIRRSGGLDDVVMRSRGHVVIIYDTMTFLADNCVPRTLYALRKAVQHFDGYQVRHIDSLLMVMLFCN